MNPLDVFKNVINLMNLMLGSKIPTELIERVFGLLEAFSQEGLDTFEYEYRYLVMHIRRAIGRGNDPSKFIEDWLAIHEG